jgi:hypothetical protein
VTKTLEWSHPLQEVLGSLIEAGLTITGFREYDHLSWQGLPHMVQDGEGWWRLPSDSPAFPLMFAVTATR